MFGLGYDWYFCSNYMQFLFGPALPYPAKSDNEVFWGGVADIWDSPFPCQFP